MQKSYTKRLAALLLLIVVTLTFISTGSVLSEECCEEPIIFEEEGGEEQEEEIQITPEPTPEPQRRTVSVNTDALENLVVAKLRKTYDADCDLVLTIVPEKGYTLPDAIQVRIDGRKKTVYCDTENALEDAEDEITYA